MMAIYFNTKQACLISVDNTVIYLRHVFGYFIPNRQTIYQTKNGCLALSVEDINLVPPMSLLLLQNALKPKVAYR